VNLVLLDVIDIFVLVLVGLSLQSRPAVPLPPHVIPGAIKQVMEAEQDRSLANDPVFGTSPASEFLQLPGNQLSQYTIRSIFESAKLSCALRIVTST